MNFIDVDYVEKQKLDFYKEVMNEIYNMDFMYGSCNLYVVAPRRIYR